MASNMPREDPTVATVRLEKKKLRELQYYLSVEDTNFTQFVVQKVDEFLHEYRARHPEHVPGGAHRASASLRA
jgi:hypothetical protein